MRGTITLGSHTQHAWLHFTIRLLIVILLIFLLLVLTENSFGKSSNQDLTSAEIMFHIGPATA